MQFCYQTTDSVVNSTTTIRSFDLLFLTQNRFRFRIHRIIVVRTRAEPSICREIPESENTEQICCDRVENFDSFKLPNSNFTFGLLIGPAELLALTSSLSEYQFSQISGRLRRNAVSV